MKKYLPFIFLGIAVFAIALVMPSAGSVRVEKARLTPTPEIVVTPEPTFTPAPTNTPIPAPETYTLRSMTDQTSSYDDVKAIQARLSQLGFYAGAADGSTPLFHTPTHESASFSVFFP